MLFFYTDSKVIGQVKYVEPNEEENIAAPADEERQGKYVSIFESLIICIHTQKCQMNSGIT